MGAMGMLGNGRIGQWTYGAIGRFSKPTQTLQEHQQDMICYLQFLGKICQHRLVFLKWSLFTRRLLWSKA